jgi:integrase
LAQVKLPKWVQAFTRHGKQRHYFRRRGYPRVALPGAPWSAEFMAVYAAALEGTPLPRVSSLDPGSAGAVVLAYLASDNFAKIRSPNTRKTHKGILERFAAKYGDRPFSLIDRHGIELILGREKPFAARNLRNVLRRMFKWRRGADPTIGVELDLPQTDGWHTMTDDERAAFEARWPIGTKERAIYAVLFYTALRISDAARLGPQHVRNAELVLRLQKNGEILTQEVKVQMLAAIKAANMPLGMAFLLTKYGRPYTAKGLANRFKAACKAAGLPHCSAHSVRKGTATMIADAGKSEYVIAAFLGDKSLRMAEVYTKKRNTAKLAREASTVFETETGTELSTVTRNGDRKAKK